MSKPVSIPKMLNTRQSQSLADMFWALIQQGAIDECWPWLGATNGAGYGIVRMLGAKFYAHRQAYTEARGPIAAGMVIRHSCDNPICCNPAHLDVGTMRDNTQDAVTRGKMHGRNCTRGSAHHRSRLTEQQVSEMRRKYDINIRGDASKAAREFNISHSTADRVLRGTSWSHI